MDFIEWEEKTRESHLTISDVLEMKPNSFIKLACLDRNVLDMASDANTEGVGVKPSVFFRTGYFLTFTKGDEQRSVKGDAVMSWDGSSVQRPAFEFDLEYENDSWYPLFNDHLPLEPDLITDKKYCGVSWKTYPVETRLGWRGPMIPVTVLDTLPDVSWGCQSDSSE